MKQFSGELRVNGNVTKCWKASGMVGAEPPSATIASKAIWTIVDTIMGKFRTMRARVLDRVEQEHETKTWYVAV